MEGPDTVARAILEPVQNTDGALAARLGYWQRFREICDRYGVLLVSDEVICAFGRLGDWFGCDRFGYQPNMIVFTKSVTSGYAPLGGIIVSDRLAAPFLGDSRTFLHGLTFEGHPVSCAVASANVELMEREDLLGNVRHIESVFAEFMARSGELRIVGQVSGYGYFRIAELVKDKHTKTTFTDEECARMLRGALSPALYKAGLFCCAGDRADPVVVLSPPLTCGADELNFIGDTPVEVFTDVWNDVQSK